MCETFKVEMKTLNKFCQYTAVAWDFIFLLRSLNLYFLQILSVFIDFGCLHSNGRFFVTDGKIIMLIFMWTTTTCLAKMVSQFSLKSVIANNVELIPPRILSWFPAEISMHNYKWNTTLKLGMFELQKSKNITILTW